LNPVKADGKSFTDEMNEFILSKTKEEIMHARGKVKNLWEISESDFP
jgi:hypothetical protein